MKTSPNSGRSYLSTLITLLTFSQFSDKLDVSAAPTRETGVAEVRLTSQIVTVHVICVSGDKEVNSPFYEVSYLPVAAHAAISQTSSSLAPFVYDMNERKLTPFCKRLALL